MNYYVFDNNWDFDCIKEIKVPSVYNEISLDFGTPFGELPPIEIDLKGNKLPDAIPTHQRYLIFNQRLLDMIKSYGVDYLEEFQVLIKRNHEEIHETEYKCVNILKLVDAIDRDQSELTLDEDDEIDFLDKLVLKYEFEELPIFRVKDLEILTLFREDLAQEIVNNYFTGMEFYPATGYRI